MLTNKIASILAVCITVILTGLLCRTVFVVGATQDEAQQQKLDEEIRTHGDIIQYNFIDSYANLTYKTLSLLSWGVTRCSEVQFLAKIDDDVLVNPFHLKVFVQDTLQHPPAPKVGRVGCLEGRKGLRGASLCRD
ncbi:UDP-GlcNAc:betaGal beta-1,3-N-acetylglucosaminyltransferase 7 [Portunus trituberculatus]|uniref:Hexosyltransferase n=1 Tax=Portunus trituberculatus TaxID=210409 RepID=A0A5B7IL71_PORTR|nr:UDP-GlcNAc:betaGal beta-1,3-N-acetylglucosaminyltransferase 7 [Portunus trituberculatus]